MKKLITLFLCIVLLCCPLYVSAQTAEPLTAIQEVSLLNYGDLPKEQATTYPRPKIRSSTDIYEYLRECIAKNEVNAEYSLTQFNIPFEYFTYEDESGVEKTGIDTPLSQYFEETVNYYPELFNADNWYSFSYDDVNMVITGIIPQYRMTKQEYQVALQEYYAKIDYIISGIQKDWSDLEKVLYVHNYLVANCEYDLNLFGNAAQQETVIYNAYDFLMTGVGVCQAYTQAFNAIMHRLGINSTSAIDYADNHTWNVVQIDGKYYHLDLTHDDPIYIAQSDGAVRYDNFLMSSETTKTRESHSEWYTIMAHLTCDDRAYSDGSGTDSYVCVDKTFESEHLWLAAHSAVSFCNDRWFFIAVNIYGRLTLHSTTDFKSYVSEYTLQNCYVYNGSYLGALTVAGTSLYFNEVSIATDESVITCFDTLTGNTEKYSFTTEETPSSCIYRGNGKVSVCYPSGMRVNENDEPIGYLYDEVECTVFPIMGNTNDDAALNAADIVNARSYLIGNDCSFNWAVLDTVGNMGVDLLDFIRLKKLVAMS